ncbi:serine threonine protein kinase [Stylonychia lemnae]|uniref:Casein kinase I n=1 Tax=Stylonychia lemnae TaxID=5949 RepID=A0A078A5X6_STYLE|nr:serine threonine protein kinase [Stylonychia lemnae]|eukprot:CDW76955.1 serine threonine protein kinase [Stylonychia lemnae]
MDQMFYTEVKIMKSLRKYNITGFPRLEQYGSIDEELGFIAMELLGPNSLEVLRKIESRKSKEKLYGLPLASISSLEGMHETGYLHSDVKPNNVVFDQFSEIEDFFSIDQRGQVLLNDRTQVYLLDFGLSEAYLLADGSHIIQDKINRQLGNKFFMSLSQLKKNVQFRQAFDYVKSLSFNERPDYNHLIKIFKSMMQTQTVEYLVRSCLKRPIIVTPREIDDTFEFERKKTHSLNEYNLNTTNQALFLQRQYTNTYNEIASQSTQISPQNFSQISRNLPLPEQGPLYKRDSNNNCCQTSDELRNGLYEEKKSINQSNNTDRSYNQSPYSMSNSKQSTQKFPMTMDVNMSREEECVKVESEHGAGEEEEAPTSRFQSIYRRQPKPMDLRSLRGGVL